jgi:hypothetical protein
VPTPRCVSEPLASRWDWLAALAGLLFAGLVLAPSLAGRTAFLPADLWQRALPFALSPPPGIRDFPSNVLHGDAALIYPPQLWVVRETLREGSFPLWNRFYRAGEPMLGAGTAGPLTPLTWPILLLPWPTGFAWSALLRFGVMWAGAFLYAREMRLSRASALTLAAAFCFVPHFIVHFQQLPRANAHCWLPWLLWGIERLASATPLGARAQLRAAAPIPFAALCTWLAGYPPAAFHVSLGVAAYAALRLPWRPLRSGLQARAVGFAMLGLGFAMAAPVVACFAELLRDSSTYSDRATTRGQWTLPAAVLRLYWNPFAHGSPLIGATRSWTGPENFEEVQQYVGIVPWVFLLASLPRVLRRGGDDALRIAAWLAIGLFAAALAYGWQPLHRWLTAVPPFAFSSNPRLLILAHAAVPVLALLLARGWPHAGSRSRPLAFASFAAVAAAAVPLLVVSAATERREARSWIAAGGSAALFAAGSFATTRRERRGAAALLPILMLADVAPVYRGYHPQVPRAWADPARVASLLPEALRSGPNPRVAFESATPPNLPALFGIEDVRAYNFPVPLRYDLYTHEAMGLPAPLTLLPEDLVRPEVIAGLERTCAGWLLTTVRPGPPLSARLELVWEHQRRLRLYRLEHASPCAAWYPESAISWVPTRAEAVERLRTSLADVEEAILVEEPGASARSAPPQPGFAVEARFATPQRIEVELPPAARGTDGAVVLRVSHDPGWTASSGGAPLAVRPAQVRFLAVEAPAGTERIVLRYRPRHFFGWLAVAGAAALASIAILVLTRLSVSRHVPMDPHRG